MERPGPTARTDGAPRKAHKMTETRRKQKDPEKGQEPPDGIRRGAAVPSPPSYHTTGFPASATPPAFRDLHDAHPMVSETPLAFTLRLEEEGGGFVDPGRCTLVLHVGWDGQQEVLERRRTFQLKGPSRWALLHAEGLVFRRERPTESAGGALSTALDPRSRESRGYASDGSLPFNPPRVGSWYGCQSPEPRRDGPPPPSRGIRDPHARSRGIGSVGKVEVVTIEALSPFLGPRILAEAFDVLRAA